MAIRIEAYSIEGAQERTGIRHYEQKNMCIYSCLLPTRNPWFGAKTSTPHVSPLQDARRRPIRRHWWAAGTLRFASVLIFPVFAINHVPELRCCVMQVHIAAYIFPRRRVSTSDMWQADPRIPMHVKIQATPPFGRIMRALLLPESSFASHPSSMVAVSKGRESDP